MLNEHLFDGLFREIRIDRLPAKREEVVESCAEAIVRLLFSLDYVFDSLSKLWNLILKLLDGLLPIFILRRQVFEKLFENFNERDGLSYVQVQNRSAILPKNRAFGHLEDDVVLRITGIDFLLYLFGKIIMGIFRFPESMWQPIFINQRSVDTNGPCFVAPHPFGNEFPTKPLAAVFQEVLEGRPHRALVRNSQRFKFFQGQVVILNCLVCGFEVESFHRQAIRRCMHASIHLRVHYYNGSLWPGTINSLKASNRIRAVNAMREIGVCRRGCRREDDLSL